MGIFRYENRYAAPTRERYLRGEVEEHHFGPDGQITLLLYAEAAYLKDDIDDVRVLFTGIRDKSLAPGKHADWWTITRPERRPRSRLRPEITHCRSHREGFGSFGSTG